MRYLRLALLPLLFASCTEREPAAPDTGIAPSLRASAANDVVYLHPGRLTWLDNDAAAGDPPDVLLFGYDPAEHGACTGGTWPGGIPAREHYVVSMEGFPNEFSQRDQSILTTIGRPPLYMYDYASVPVGGTAEELCDFFTNGWFAVGSWSATIATDNDISGGDQTPGVNTWGGTETGTLRGTDGTTYIYSWKYRLILEPERGFFKVANEIDQVRRAGN